MPLLRLLRSQQHSCAAVNLGGEKDAVYAGQL